jgi:excinuclease UvrABC nuclease subunit
MEETMASQSYDLTYAGYWREVNKGGIPNESGVYTVYAATYDPNDKTVSLRMVIYIGESADVGGRIASHEKTDAWKRHLKRGEDLCFNFAPVGSASRLRVEAGLINHHKPPVNVEYVDNFPFDETTITTSGRRALLSPSFTVQRTRVAARS